MVNFNHLKLSGIIAASGKTQKEVAVILGVHKNTVSNWATSKSKPDPEQLTALFAAIGYNPENDLLVDWYPAPADPETAELTA